MRSRYRVHEPERAPTAAGKGLLLHGWVIMDNHFHAIVKAPELSATLADLKKFTARRLLALLAAEGRDWLVELLGKERARHKTRSQHQVWQEGFHPQAIHDDAMMLQKLDSMHHNPVRRGWVAAPEHWRHSSAHEWLPGSSPIIVCDAWR